MQELRAGSLLQNGKYYIEGMLGQGGFGITYRATMQSSMTGNLGSMDVDVPVAIKEFFIKDLCVRNPENSWVSVPTTGSKEQTLRYREKFIKEARNIATLSHPHIVKVLDVFEENGTVYYAMQFLPGGSLRDRMKQGPMAEQEAVGYIRQIADALGYMHQKKHLCHYDVKPGNILLDKRGQAKLIDFGISKNYDRLGKETSSTPVGLSAGYAPLEQYQNALHDFSPTTDIYSLGATLLALLTGQTPPEAALVLERGIGQQPAGVSLPTWQAVWAAMRPVRTERPQTIADFLNILDNGLPAGFAESTVKVESTATQPLNQPSTAKDPFDEFPDNKPSGMNPVVKFVGIVLAAALLTGGGFWVVSSMTRKTAKEQVEAAKAATTVTDYPVTVTVDGKQTTFKYTGPLVDSQPEGHGNGVYTTNADGVTATYEGDYHKGLRHGRGKIFFSSGDTYEGGFRNDKFEGKGRYTFAPSKDDDAGTYAYYEGTYKADKELNGTWYNRDGKRLVDVKNGKEIE